MAENRTYSNKAFDAPKESKERTERGATNAPKGPQTITIEVIKEYAGIIPGFRKTVEENSVRTRYMIDNSYWKIVSR